VDVRALSGRPVIDVTVAAALAGELGPADTRIHPETLRAQAAVADEHGNPELGENLRRAAELALLPDQDVLAIYAALRPRRSSRAELEAIAARLAAAGASRSAAFVAEAAAAYERRKLLR
jgi:propanediol dehydratase small subunit